MNRLTKWNDKTEGAELISWNEEEWKDFMGSLDVPICTELSLAVDKLTEYEDLEEQEKLIRLPCKVGDTVYSVECDRIEKFIASHFDVCLKSIYALQGDFFIGEIGHTVFATKDEAEQALAKMKEV